MPTRVYIVTFDLPGAVPGDQRYARVDKALKTLGTLIRPAKQVRLVISRRDARHIRAVVSSITGVHSDIIVARLTKGYAVRLRDPMMRREVVDALKKYS